MERRKLLLHNFPSYYATNCKDGQNLIFISVGSAANMEMKKEDTLHQKDMHQYPPYIQNIKQMFPMLPIHLILIDPWLTTPSYIVKNLEKEDKRYDIDVEFDNIYHFENSTNVYEFKDYVTYKGMSNDNKEFDITNMLEELNDFCITNNHILLFHDFSGRNTWKLAYYFDKKLNQCDSSIIYDITLRMEGTCSIDLTNPTFSLPLFFDDEKISIFNPYKLTNQDLFLMLNRDDNKHLKQILITVYKKRISMLVDDLYPIYRRFKKHTIDMKKDSSIELASKFIDRVYNDEFYMIDMLFEKDILNKINCYKASIGNEIIDISLLESIIDTMEDCLREYLYNLLRPFDDDEIIKIRIAQLIEIIDENIYKWPQEIRKMIEEDVIQKFGIDLSIVKIFDPYVN